MVYRQTVVIDSGMSPSGTVTQGQFTPSTYSPNGRYKYNGSTVINEVDWRVRLLSDANFRLYSCKVKYGGTDYFDFVPCVRKSDGEIGLYDLISDTFYSNASGGGTFTRGPLVNIPYNEVTKIYVGENSS